MYIAPQLGRSHFNNNPEEVQPLKDFFDIFHGRYLCTKTHFGLDQFSYRTADGYVTGSSNPLGGCDPGQSVTELWISELTRPKQAIRWTAVEVYKQLYYMQYETNSWFKGFQGRHLALVVPERDIQEWARQPKAEGDPDFRVETAYENDDLASDKEVSVLIARGDTLLVAAQTMVRGYGALLSSSDIDPALSELDASMTVAQSLGCTSMTHLEEMWADALKQSDPQAAARFAYRTLTS